MSPRSRARTRGARRRAWTPSSPRGSPASSPARSTRTPGTAVAWSGLRAAGVETELVDSFEARQQNEAWRTWAGRGRPFVTYKVAVTLDGRVTLPGSRWISGEASRRLVHELRAASDAVAVGMGTVRADAPRLDARDVEAARQPRRLAFGKGPLPEASELELRSGPLDRELSRLAEEGVQSLLLEGGPDAGECVSRAGTDRQAARLRRPGHRRKRPSVPDRPRGIRSALPFECATGRRGRPA